MNSSRLRRKKKDLNREVFRKKSKLNLKFVILQFIVALFMLCIGIYLFNFLNRISNTIHWNTIIKEAWLDLFEGFGQLFNSLLAVGAAGLTFLLIILCIVLLLGSTWRLIRIIIICSSSIRERTGQYRKRKRYRPNK